MREDRLDMTEELAEEREEALDLTKEIQRRKQRFDSWILHEDIFTGDLVLIY